MDRKITRLNCKRLTRLDYSQLLSLTGIFGLYTTHSAPTPTVSAMVDDTVHIEFETDLIELDVRIDIRKQTIINEVINSTGALSHLGYRLLRSQISAARKSKYKCIKLFAWGNIDTVKPSSKKKYSGFIDWGKLGYSMDVDSHKSFLLKMRVHNRPEKTLFDLLFTEDGADLWANLIGEEWLGVMKLHANSTSLKDFRRIENKYSQ